jgi:NitT/TauT family transport system ATP-binding protein
MTVVADFAVEVEGLSKRFSDEEAFVIEGLDFQVKKGEFICLLGASGCGKSTLLNILADLDSPTVGTVRVADRPTLMFQDASLMPWLTAGQNVELALRIKGMGKEQRRVRAQELLELVHLGSAFDKRPHELSGGMRQRVSIARALAQEKSILLMDEPFAALDAITRDFLHEELLGIWKRTGLTVVFVTHNVREAVRLGQRVILMSSKPGRFINEWDIKLTEPRRIDAPEVANLASEITDHLRNEIKRHG